MAERQQRGCRDYFWQVASLLESLSFTTRIVASHLKSSSGAGGFSKCTGSVRGFCLCRRHVIFQLDLWTLGKHGEAREVTEGEVAGASERGRGLFLASAQDRQDQHHRCSAAVSSGLRLQVESTRAQGRWGEATEATRSRRSRSGKASPGHFEACWKPEVARTAAGCFVASWNVCGCLFAKCVEVAGRLHLYVSCGRCAGHRRENRATEEVPVFKNTPRPLFFWASRFHLRIPDIKPEGLSLCF